MTNEQARAYLDAVGPSTRIFDRGFSAAIEAFANGSLDVGEIARLIGGAS